MGFLVQASDPIPVRTGKLSATEAARSPSPVELGLLSAITVLAAVLRFHALAARTFWFDEGVSIGIARLQLVQLWTHFVASRSQYVTLLSAAAGLGALWAE